MNRFYQAVQETFKKETFMDVVRKGVLMEEYTSEKERLAKVEVLEEVLSADKSMTTYEAVISKLKSLRE